MKTIAGVLENTRVVPVIVIDKLADAVPLAECLVSVGLRVLEVTLRTNAALDAVKAIISSVGDCVVGVGSILDAHAMHQAIDAGAAFGVSPGTTPAFLDELKKTDWPFLPGAGSVSEIMTLRAAGYTHQKLFPASLVGGVSFLKAVSGPLAGVSFCPTGGISEDAAPSYLAQKNVFAIGGSWIAPKDLISSRNWNEIVKRAKTASAL